MNSPRQNHSPLLRVVFIVIVLSVCFAIFQFIRQWRAREAVRRLRNPVPASVEALAHGQTLYENHCQRCHGVKGDGRGEKAAELSEQPIDFTDAKQMSVRADGEIFMPIEQGVGPMPAFMDKMTEQQAWELVDYVRTFAGTRSGGR